MNNITVPYVYLVGWTDLDKYYIGVKYKKGSHPRDFWVKYFTSSKEVPKFRREHGEPDILLVIREHKTAEDAVRHEDKLLRRLNAVKSDRFLNRARSGVEWAPRTGVPLTEEHKQRIREANTGRVFTPEQRKKISDAHKATYQADPEAESQKRSARAVRGENHPYWGKSLPQEVRDKISAALKGRPGHTHTPEVLERISQKLKGRVISDETRAKFSAAVRPPKTEEHRRNLSEANKGKTMPPHVKEKLLAANIGRKKTPEEIEKIRASIEAKGPITVSAETRAKISAAHKGKEVSAETRAKLSLALKGVPVGPQPLVTCPYCGKVGGASTMKRWHFDNCKQKPVE